MGYWGFIGTLMLLSFNLTTALAPIIVSLSFANLHAFVMLLNGFHVMLYVIALAIANVIFITKVLTR